MPRRRFLWITDPWETLDHSNDTTLRLAQEAVALGHESYWCSVRSIQLRDGELKADVHRLFTGAKALGAAFAWPRAGLAHFHFWHYRVDPPVDLSYSHPLQLLCLNKLATKRLVNPPDVLFTINEKFGPKALSDLMPAMLVSSDAAALEAFVVENRGAVLKPLHLAQSRGVEKVDAQNRTDLRSKLQAATEDFARPILLQQFLPGIAKGEQRLWFVDGKLLTHVTKHPIEGDFRVNMDRGSRVSVRALNAREKRAAARIGRELRRLGARLAAVDLVDGRIIDFNITSPGLLPTMERITGRNLAKAIVQALAR